MTGEERFPATMDRLAGEVEDRLFTRGVQISIWCAGSLVLDASLGDDGLGRPVGRDTILRVYCTIKPVTALATGLLVESGELDLDLPLTSYLAPMAALDGGVTARHLLTHTSGLHRPSALEVEMVPPAGRPALLQRQLRPPGWQIGRDAGYSEFVAWQALGLLLEELSGQDLRTFLRERLLDPLGMADTWIGMTAEEYGANRDRIGVNVDLRSLQSYPMLFERTERVCRETNPAHGGYTTAGDLALLYRSILDALAGEPIPGLPGAGTLAQYCSTARPKTLDVVLDRECEYGLGLMTSLEGHHFGRSCSPGSFGHSGNVGSSFAFADPDPDLAVAVVFNAIVDHESAFLRRPSLTRSIYGDLGLLDQPADPDPPARRRWWRRGG